MEAIAIGVCVGFVLVLLVAGIVVVVVCICAIRAAKHRSYKPDRMPSVDNSPPSTCDGTPDFISVIETPDLGRKANGGHELRELDGQFVSKSPHVPSGTIKMDKFSEHVDLFDSNRQLLFQEEYDVSLERAYMYINTVLGQSVLGQDSRRGGVWSSANIMCT